MNARDQLIRELDRTAKRDLIAMARAVAPTRGDRWLFGGPEDWSKDQLINYLAPAATS